MVVLALLMAQNKVRLEWASNVAQGTGPPCFDTRVLVLNGLRSQPAAKFRWKVVFLENYLNTPGNSSVAP